LVRHGRTLHLPENGSVALALTPGGDKERDKKSGNNCSFCSARICRAKDLGSTKKFCLVYNPEKPVPAAASDNERTFVFTSRTYVDVVKPDTMKGISWQKIQDTVKEHKGKVAPVVAPASASGAEKPEVTAQAPASATGAMAAPIISSQAEFNAWFSSLNSGPAGTQKVVNMVAHSEANNPINDQGGSLATVNALTLLLLSNGYHHNGGHFIKTDGAGTVRFQAHTDDGVGWSNSRELHTELCALLKEVWPRMQWEGDGDNPMAFTIVRDRRSASDAWLSSLNGAAAGSSQVVNMIVHSEADTPVMVKQDHRLRALMSSHLSLAMTRGGMMAVRLMRRAQASVCGRR